jgi:hypothetical protein
MLGEDFNDLVSPMSHEGINVFIWFNGYVHDSVKVIQYCTSHFIVFDFFPSNINAKLVRRATRKGKWALDRHPTQS